MGFSYPICFAPVYRNYLWGGDRIQKQYQRNVSLSQVAESWEIADREDGMSFVSNGPLKGKSLRELVLSMGEDLFGLGRSFSSFPLLVKILDASHPLSIQVHPGPTTAPLMGGESKNEMWYLIEADAAAQVYAGLKPTVNQEILLKAVHENCIEEALEVVQVQSGDAIYIPGGCVHGIGSGCFILEVQQNSDTTYRIFDWNRKGADHKPRELHLDQALATIDWAYRAQKNFQNPLCNDSNYSLSSVMNAPDFQMQRLDIRTIWPLPCCPNTFQIFFCLSGEGTIVVDGHTENLCIGRTYLVPAQFRKGEVKGVCQLIRIFL